MKKQDRQSLRKEKIQARESLSENQIREMSQRIAERILASNEFREADKIMIYRGIGGEVRLDRLELAKESEGKQFLFPLCLPERQMAALCPQGEDAWKTGAYGIMEPVPEKSILVEPEDIDLIICPCTVFDEDCNRMGMGGGYYDRYLPKCQKAVVAAVALEIQKTAHVPMEPWDKAVALVFTEKKTYRKK